MNHISPFSENRASRALSLALLLAATTAASPLYAVDGSWLTGTGTWSTPGNWSSNPTLPGGSGSTINLDFNIGGGATVTLDVSPTVGILNIGDTNNSASYSLVGSGSPILTFNNGGSGAQINNLPGSANANLIFASVAMSLQDNLTLSNQAAGSRLLTINSPISAGTAGTKTITNAGTGTASMALAGTITNGSGTVAIVQDSATSTLTISGNSSGATGYSGGLSLRQGTMIFGGNGAWGRGDVNIGHTSGSTAVTIDVSSARAISTVNTQRWNQNFTFTGTSTLNTGTGAVILAGNRQVTVAASTLTIGGGISDGGSAFTLTKAGAGTMALNAANTYTGGTTVSAGTLLLGSAGTLASQSYTIGNGALFDVSSKASYSLAGITNFSGITFSLDAATAGRFNAGTAALTLDDQLTLDFSTGALGAGTTYNLFDMGSQTGSFSAVALTGSLSGSLSLTGDLWSGTAGGYAFAFDESNGVLSVTAVPEPTTYALLGLGALVFLQRRRRY